MRAGHTYSDRSALRFEAEDPTKPKQFVHPVMDPHYGDKPSMISETTFNRPNRYRSEAPLYFAAYGALQGSDALGTDYRKGTKFPNYSVSGSADYTVSSNFVMSGRVGRFENSDARALTIATPADGPSLGTAPAGTWMWTPAVFTRFGSMPSSWAWAQT